MTPPMHWRDKSGWDIDNDDDDGGCCLLVALGLIVLILICWSMSPC